MITSQDSFTKDQKIKHEILARFGFRLSSPGVHMSRTIMLEDLSTVLAYVDNQNATKDDYYKAIVTDNCLGKRSGNTRSISHGFLVRLYGLDPEMTIFRTLLYFWKRDPKARQLLALLCAYCKDSLIILSFAYINQLSIGSKITKESLEEFIERKESDKYSSATRKSMVRNLSSSWTKSGHLRGRTKKYRSKAIPSCGSVCYALFLGHLIGLKGQSLFKSEFCELLDSSFEDLLNFALEGSRRGWIVFKRIEDVMEVQFPGLINSIETKWLDEQS